METFNFVVEDKFLKMTFEGNVKADTKEQAYQEVLEIYSQELDTTEEGLDITIFENMAGLNGEELNQAHSRSKLVTKDLS